MNVTALTPMKPAPVIVTVVPTGPEVGENEVITAGVTVKAVDELAVPPGDVTATLPVVAPLGTLTVIEVGELTV